LILVHRLVGARAHGFFFIFLPGGILPLLLVLGQVDTISTNIVALDPFFLLDTHSHEIFKCTSPVSAHATSGSSWTMGSRASRSSSSSSGIRCGCFCLAICISVCQVIFRSYRSSGCELSVWCFATVTVLRIGRLALK
jgi:hypothetical protein